MCLSVFENCLTCFSHFYFEFLTFSLFILDFSCVQLFCDTSTLVKLLETQLLLELRKVSVQQVTGFCSGATVRLPEGALDQVGHFLVVLVELVLQPQYSAPLTDALSTQRRACAAVAGEKK